MLLFNLGHLAFPAIFVASWEFVGSNVALLLPAKPFATIRQNMPNIKLSLYLLILLIFLVTSCNAQKNDSKFISKTFPKYGIIISLPEDWDFSEGSENMKNKIFKCNFKETNNKTQYNTVGVSLSYEVMKKAMK